MWRGQSGWQSGAEMKLAIVLLALLTGCSNHKDVPIRTVRDGHCPKDDSLPKKYTLRGELKDEHGKVVTWASTTNSVCPGEQLMVWTYIPPDDTIHFDSNGGPESDCDKAIMCNYDCRDYINQHEKECTANSKKKAK